MSRCANQIYVEETNIRLGLWYALLNCQELFAKSRGDIEAFVEFALTSLLDCELEFDVRFYNLNVQFLPFKNFQPFRAEALWLLKLFLDSTCLEPQLLAGLVDQMFVHGCIERETERARDRSNKLSYLNAFGFLSLILQMCNPRVVSFMVG